MKTRFYRRILLVISILVFLAVTCSLPTQARNNSADPDSLVQTAAVQTIDAMMTEVSQTSMTSTPGGPATDTPQSPTFAPSATSLPASTSVTLPTTTATPICDQAGFVSDVTIPDGATLSAGTSFEKVWRLRNTGACTWSSDYAIVFDSGASYTSENGPTSQTIGQAVPPGQTVDVRINLKAPGAPGSYKWSFKLRNAAGVIFGLGSRSQTFYVDFKVGSITPASGSYDFTANHCLAEWTGNEKPLSCVGTDGSSDGFVLYKTRPILETGYVDDEPALLTNPPRVTDGIIRGKYPVFTVKSGDRFISLIGCEHNAANCNVRFQLDYQIDNGPIQTLASWHEVYDSSFTQIEQDLSSLAGSNVKFILTVHANGPSDNDRALWLLPRIVNDSP